jgi:TusE/DsrC/DsvC family sulfur relay protein
MEQDGMMPTLEYAGRNLELNDDGFLVHPEEWDEDLACFLARTAEGLEALGPDHWAVLRFIRGHYLAHGSAPMVRLLCKATGLHLRRVYQLFPSGPARGACKVAGLPKPDGCV